MKDRQKIFLDRVVKLLVDDTEIDYNKGELLFPYRLYGSFPIKFRDTKYFPSYFSRDTPKIVKKYCTNNYGLNEEEIDFVWKEYKDSIRDKIKNNER